MREEFEVTHNGRIFYVDIWWTLDYDYGFVDYGTPKVELIFRVVKIDEALDGGAFGEPTPRLSLSEQTELVKLARVAFDNEMERRQEMQDERNADR